jgi:hypothetical protein
MSQQGAQMPGGFRRYVVAVSTVGLAVTGLATGPGSTRADPAAPAAVCAVVSQPLTVANMEPQRPKQKLARDSWPDVDNPNHGLPWLGLYAYPYTDNDPTRGLPRQESWGATANTPATPVQMGDHFQWRLRGLCGDGAAIDVMGKGIGVCGRSVGVGWGSVHGRPAVIRWETVGGHAVLLDPSARGALDIVNVPDDVSGSCHDGSAMYFRVDGVIAVPA